MMYVTKSTSADFKAILNRRSNSTKSKQTVTLSRILKNGKPGKPNVYELYGCEKTAQDVIARLEKNNPGCKWVEA